MYVCLYLWFAPPWISACPYGYTHVEAQMMGLNINGDWIRL